MWDAIKTFFFYILKWIGFIGMTLFAFIMVYTLFSETSGALKPIELGVVEEKYSHKGLYFAQSYYIKTSNGKSHSIFKHDFKTLEVGDSFQPFFNSLSWKDFWIIIFIAGTVSILFLSLAYFFAFLLFHQMKSFRKLEAKRKQIASRFASLIPKNNKTREQWKKRAFLILIIVFIIPYILMAKNIVVKVIPLGKESAIAEIQARDITKSTGIRKISDIYTLTYTFTDENNETYKTKKDVSRYTYNKYEDRMYVPIIYRENFPYESFIDIKSGREVFSAILRSSNLIFLLNASLLIYFIKKYIDTWGVPFLRRSK